MQYDACQVYEKTEAGTDPETWQQADTTTLRIAITPLPERKAIEMVATGRYNRAPTHTGLADWSEALQPMRLLKRIRDGAYFYIESTRPHGRVNRGATHARQLRLTLSYDEAEHTL